VIEINFKKKLSEKVLKLETSSTFALHNKAIKINEGLRKKNDRVTQFGIGEPDLFIRISFWIPNL